MENINISISFEESLKKLNIEDYKDRILKSNSHGELFHINDYIALAKYINASNSNFREWFEDIVKQAEEKWIRPESIFQHIRRIFVEQYSKNYNNE